MTPSPRCIHGYGYTEVPLRTPAIIVTRIFVGRGDDDHLDKPPHEREKFALPQGKFRLEPFGF